MTRVVTRDVDAFAVVRRRRRKLVLVSAKPLPDILLREAAIVGKDFGLSADWLNSEPTSIIDLDLPDGLEKRLHAVKYGKRLTLHYLDRWDQIHFKLQAAADNSPASRHFADLVAMKPTKAELEAASRWAMTQDPSEGFQTVLKKCLEHLGHEDLARGL